MLGNPDLDNFFGLFGLEPRGDTWQHLIYTFNIGNFWHTTDSDKFIGFLTLWEETLFLDSCSVE